MNLLFSRLSDEQLVALYRCAKTRGRAFFRDPYDMINLRLALQRRNLI